MKLHTQLAPLPLLHNTCMRATYFFTILCIIISTTTFAQDKEQIQKERFEKLTSILNGLTNEIEGLNKTVDFNVSDIELSSFLRAIGKSSKVNISVASPLRNITLTHNFSNASIKDILIYLCKEYQLTFSVTGNIIALKKFTPKPPKKKIFTPKNIPITYLKSQDLFSIDVKNDSLYRVFKKITNVTGKNLVFSPQLSGKRISGYIKNKGFDSAMDKLAFSNNLLVTKTKDNYYLFEDAGNNLQRNSKNKTYAKPRRYRSANFFFKITDKEEQLLAVDFENAAIASVIKEIGDALQINMFTNTPLEGLGTASVKAKNISFDQLIQQLLEDKEYTFKKNNGIYFFGSQKQPSLRSAVVIPLLHRSIEVMNEPSPIANNTINYPTTDTNNNYSNNSYSNYQNPNRNNNPIRNINTSNNSSFQNYSTKSEALVNILPKDIIKGLEVKTDIEHNTFIVSGDAQKIEQFKKFIGKIDKPVPVILIEVMILEVSKSASISTGLNLGIGSEPKTNTGSIYPKTDLTIGATSINKIIGSFNSFTSLNIGRVVSNFFGRLKLMEDNGFIKIRSTPKLSTLNGHQATLSNGERSYYKIERTDLIGAQNPQVVKTSNYIPIDANLTINIRPIVSGDGQITLGINVLQSSFNGKRIDQNAPPGMNSRQFTSTIRVRDQDVVILGGLEETLKDDSGSGVPLLARIPIIKWFFSNKTRKDSKSKLSVLIRPTIIR